MVRKMDTVFFLVDTVLPPVFTELTVEVFSNFILFFKLIANGQ